MKKTKWIKSLGVVSALTMPVATVLTTATSCGNKNYTELVSELKDATISKFIELSQQVHRSVWNEGEAYKYIKKQMQSMGFTDPSGYDRWSEVRTVYLERASEMATLKQKGETDGGEYGNLWYDIPATPGYEDVPKIIIHTHMDSQMEFVDDDAHRTWAKDYESGGGINIDFDRDNEIIQSKNNKTSLGSDGGIGIAALLTLVKYRNRFNHGGLRLIFAAGESEAIAERTIENPTTHEKTTYAEYAAGFSFLEVDQNNGGIPQGETESYLGDNSTLPFGDPGEFKYMISIAGILKNSITISSAGIHECNFTTPDGFALNNDDPGQDETKEIYWTANKIDWDETGSIPTKETVSKRLITIKVSGLEGGTSSAYINKGLGNALTLLFRLAYTGDTKMQIISIESNPSSAYSICTDASMQFATFYDKDLIEMKLYSYLNYFKSLFPNEDWSKVNIEITQADEEKKAEFPKYGLSKQQSRAILRMVACDLMYGPVSWFDDDKKEVQTSENYGPLSLSIDETKFSEVTKGPLTEFKFHVVERSSDTAQLQIFYNLTHSILAEGLGPLLVDFGGDAEKYTQHISDPVWEKQTDNKMTEAFKKAYANFAITPTLNNEHAWVEIACIPEIYDRCGLGEHNIALLGPQINYNHTINETMYTDTLNSMISTIAYLLDNSRSLLS